jgi:hypothetical protein
MKSSPERLPDDHAENAKNSPKKPDAITRRVFEKQVLGGALLGAAGLTDTHAEAKAGHVEHDHSSPEGKKKLFAEAAERWKSQRGVEKVGKKEVPRFAKWFEQNSAQLVPEKNCALCIKCIDEGAFVQDAKGDLPKVMTDYIKDPLDAEIDEISIPGAGSTIDTKAFAEHLKKQGVSPDRIVAVLSHTGCAACANDDERAKAVAHSTTETLGSKGAMVGHLESLRRPDFHDAMGAYLRYSNHVMNPRRMGAPTYFDASDWALGSREERVATTALILKIAFGEHGFGENFTAKEPFELCALFDEDSKGANKAQVEAEVNEAIKKQFGDRKNPPVRVVLCPVHAKA